MPGLWLIGRAFFALACVLIITALARPGPAFASSPLIVHGLLVEGDAQRTRIAMRFDSEPKSDAFLLRNPHRLVVDFGDIRFGFKPDELASRAMVSDVRYGALEEGRSRLIFTMAGPFRIENRAVAETPAEGGWILTFDLVAATPAQFETALGQNRQPEAAAKATAKSDRIGTAPTEKRDGRFTVVLDPGHGGIDGGADGKKGTAEKTITLAFALELRAKLEATGKFNVRMTRETDQFLRLDERVRIGRQYGADLFLSIHADTIRYANIRGATVYTLSEDASDEIAKAIAEKENLSDAIAGVELKDENAEVADILLDLVRRETETFSIRFARGLVGELSKSVELIKNPHRSAGFRVLLAHDMPSVLLEIGYMSNKQDEAQMLDPAWRDKAADSVVAAISIYAAARQGEDG